VNTNSSNSAVQVLHSWKEISSYTGRGVRTLQRYEANLGFPIHRPLGKPRSSVLAFKHEIDRWMENTPLAVISAQESSEIAAPDKVLRGVNGTLVDLCQGTERCRTKTDSMHPGFVSMKLAVDSMQTKLNSMLHVLERTQGLVVKSRVLWEQTQLRRQRMRIRPNVLRPNEQLRSSSAAAI
jgi:predicted DNA-binding transcriptional regulator AlpA